jgi:hypothetical protein
MPSRLLQIARSVSSLSCQRFIGIDGQDSSDGSAKSK